MDKHQEVTSLNRVMVSMHGKIKNEVLRELTMKMLDYMKN